MSPSVVGPQTGDEVTGDASGAFLGIVVLPVARIGLESELVVDVSDCEIPDPQILLQQSTDGERTREDDAVISYARMKLSAVPEPSSTLALRDGLGCIGGMIWRAKKQSTS